MSEVAHETETESSAERPLLEQRLRTAGVSIAKAVGITAVALISGFLGWLLAPKAQAELGPLTLGLELRPSLHGGTVVQLPPIGSVAFESHGGPLLIEGSVLEVDVDKAQEIISSPQALQELEDEAPAIMIRALLKAGLIGISISLLSAAGGGYLVYRTKQRTLATFTVAVVAITGMGATTAVTFDSESLAQPQFEGLLSQAPYISTAGLDAVDRLESYRSGLSDFVQSVTALYTASENLPILPHDEDITVVLHVSDIHLNPLAYDLIEQLVPQFGVDAVLDTGDVTSWGTEAESAILAPIGRLDVPYIFVAGNHDSTLTAQTIKRFPNAVVLDDEVETVAGITWAGIADPRFLPDDNSGDGVGRAAGKQLVANATEQLADTISKYNRGHADSPVDVAVIHDPSSLGPLFGEVPLVLSGHYHRRIDRLDASGTRVRSEGSTGGAGITSRGLERLFEGNPVPMEASLLYFAASGERDGELLAYDEITVGGLGLASVNLARTIIDPNEEPEDAESDDGAIAEDAGVELPDDEEVPEPEGGALTPKLPAPGATETPTTPADPTAPTDETPSWPTLPIEPRPEFLEPEYEASGS